MMNRSSIAAGCFSFGDRQHNPFTLTLLLFGGLLQIGWFHASELHTHPFGPIAALWGVPNPNR